MCRRPHLSPSREVYYLSSKFQNQQNLSPRILLIRVPRKVNWVQTSTRTQQSSISMKLRTTCDNYTISIARAGKLRIQSSQRIILWLSNLSQRTRRSQSLSLQTMSTQTWSKQNQWSWTSLHLVRQSSSKSTKQSFPTRIAQSKIMTSSTPQAKQTGASLEEWEASLLVRQMIRTTRTPPPKRFSSRSLKQEASKIWSRALTRSDQNDIRWNQVSTWAR